MPKPLRVGIVADNPSFPADWHDVVEKVRIADQLGYDSVWLGESWGYELFTSLADLVRVTQRIKLGAGIANVFSRSPAVIAATAATLDERSNGRFLLGIGSSGPQVIEHWHGVPYAKPLQRIHEYADIINAIIRREPLKHQGEIFQLERGFKLRFKPVRDHIPLYIAAMSPKSVAQTGAIADGILPTFWPLDKVDRLRADLDAGSISAGRPAGSVTIAEYITTAVIAGEEQRDIARMLARAPIAWYIGRMGTFYADMLRRNGYGDEVEAVLGGWQRGPDTAAAAVSDRLLDATAIVGTPDEVAAGLRGWAAAGVAEPLITMPPGDVAAAEAQLGALHDALGALAD
jgi:F420-dependent oxidoreductase-like protein